MFLAGFAGMMLIGWVIFPELLYEEREQPLQFSHSAHTGDALGMTCDNCHTFAEDGRFEGIPTVAKCAECHAEPLGTSEAENRLVEEFIKQNREIPWLVYSRQPDNVYFSHVQHVEAGKLECTQCHGEHGASDSLRVYQVNRISGYSRDIWGEHISGFAVQTSDGKKMDDCANCHRALDVRQSCLGCHK
jgi:hypothetical protein